MMTPEAQVDIPKAMEGWIVEHPSSGHPVEVVTREDYDYLVNYALNQSRRADTAEAAVGRNCHC